MAKARTGGAGPLAGVLVVDLSRALAGPHAAMMLADMGARVIKVESPSGDDSRGWGPPFVYPGDGLPAEATYFLSANRNKESVVLDLKTAADGAVLADLVRRADVLVENFRPGVLDRLGFGTNELFELNPGLVLLSITGFGHDGPEAPRAGYDQIAQGESGLMSMTGAGPDDPQKMGVPICDLLAGMNGVSGVLAALLERERTGTGQVVRTSLLAAGISVHAYQGTRWTVGREVPQAGGNHHPSIAPYGMFRCADGAVQLAVGSPQLWKRLCDAFGLDAADPLFATNDDRVRNGAELVAALEVAFADIASADLLSRLSEAGVPAGRVRTLDEVYDWDQVESQGLKVSVDHPRLGPVTLSGPPLRFFDPAGEEITKVDHQAPPVLDAHGAAVRSWLEGDVSS
ncbi:Crotonobetainyl-CoA:carnitine CoA-transferase CaiB [Nocardioides alpinus]|uniref:CoA transferase n=1 Tax=Nocardioides alpinus TaxID=748909 RepID=A0A1I0Y9I2_9ACTN|nr:CoA transferase [Nocardioides alpinus]PKH38997.1 CoA transferase [Nocardioides alpinus]SFB09426.1 Crotonobetainyl-CoA:carnitine CoA-transferase CaiB [Nocardioides alpinus]